MSENYDNFFNNNVEIKGDDIKQEQKPNNEISLEQKFSIERKSWTDKITYMSKKMKKVLELNELMTYIYSERQLAVEYYHYLMNLLIKINKKYRIEYASKYDFYTNQSQIRYPNESTKVNKVLAEMSEIADIKEKVNNHAKFIDNTIKTIDNIVYAIKYRIEVEQISRGK